MSICDNCVISTIIFTYIILNIIYLVMSNCKNKTWRGSWF